MRAVLIAAFVMSLLRADSLPAQTVPSLAAPAPADAVVIDLTGQIDNFTHQTLEQRFAEARRLGAKVIILRIDTYGGLVTAGLDISRFLKRQNDLHIIAFIDQKALSAGAMIALACDEIVMSPASQLGDCAPISINPTGSIEPMPDAERAKAESPILEDFYESAIRNGYDPLLAQAMVSVGRVVHWVENDAGERRFVDQAEFEKLREQGWRPVPGVRDPVDDGSTLLTVGTDRAIKLGLASGQAGSAQELAAARGLKILAELRPGAAERLVGLLSSNIVRGILTTIFMFALYWAFSHPGHGAPEAAALVALGILVGVPLLTGYAQWWEILAILIGLALIAMEVFVIPGFGVAGITGIILVLGGLVLTWAGNEPSSLPGVLPSLAGTRAALQQGLIVVVTGLFCSLLLWIWLQRYLPKLPYVNKLVLSTPAGSVVESTDATSPRWPAVGAIGTAVTDLRPGGAAEFADAGSRDSRIADVTSDSGFLRAGTRVVVRESTGTRVVVRAVA